MPGRMKVFLAQTRKPIPAVPAGPLPPLPRPTEKSMVQKWADYKRDEKKLKKEDPGGVQP